MTSQAARKLRKKTRNRLSRARTASAPSPVRAVQAQGDVAKHTALHRLHRGNMISSAQLQAGLRYQQDHLASLDMHSSSLEFSGEHNPTSREPAPHRLRAGHDFADARRVVLAAGHQHAWLLKLATIDDRDPIEMLKSALDRLDQHYNQPTRPKSFLQPEQVAL